MSGRYQWGRGRNRLLMEAGLNGFSGRGGCESGCRGFRGAVRIRGGLLGGGRGRGY